MLASTLELIRCPQPRCARFSHSGLKLRPGYRSVEWAAGRSAASQEEIVWGSLLCEGCRSEFPILAGVAILVEDVGDYLLSHIKGIAREVPDSEFPRAFRAEMARARRELAEVERAEHIEEDLESQRVTALYVMTQYLGAREMEALSMSPEMRDLVRRYWDRGPFARIGAGLDRRLDRRASDQIRVVELGCGAGGLLPALSASLGSRLGSYLGLDGSFASVVLARRLALGIDYSLGRHSLGRPPKQSPDKRPGLKVPEDLLFGALSRDISAELRSALGSRRKPPASAGFPAQFADFIVGDAIRSPLRKGLWDACLALNLIDMLDEPDSLPRAQKELVLPGGWAIQSSPYIWHPKAAKALARKFPRLRGSAEAVTRLYEARGFSVERDGDRTSGGSGEEIPWLFFKNSRQIELYSVDLIFARLPKGAAR